MAERDPLHQPSVNARGLETGIVSLNPPLLPYEKDLISILGCTEEEYRDLVRFALLKARTRPAEYDHIPEIVNDPVTAIVVNLVVGLALTAVSALLRPETPEIEQPEQRTTRQGNLSNQIGPSRFNQTSSFDGFASLVDYGAPVPIPFGKIGEGADGARTGGLVLAGSLVWSRAYSEGNYQRVKLLYTLGEWSPAVPKKRGVWLGTTSLSALGNSDFALYWKSQEGENRIKAQNLLTGSRGTPDAGDPETQNETFIAPVDGTIEGPGFCMAYNPNSASRFGQFNPIRNGTAHRLNWEVISIPQNILRQEDKDFLDGDEYDDDEQDKVRNARVKRLKNGGEFSTIVGFQANEQYAGQPGVGRAYSSQTGLVAYAKPGGDWIGVEEKIPFLEVAKDWRVRFRIHNNDFTELEDTEFMFQNLLKGKPSDYGMDFEDVRASADSRRSRADDLMVLGSQWMIGQTIWVVTERSNYAWDPTGDSVIATLKCVGSVGSASRIGIPGQRAVKEPLGGYEGPWIETFAGPKPDFVSANGFNTKKYCGAAFWNICRYEVASARMIREADTIEFGIKSTVWNRANGLCNFNGILRPKVMSSNDSDDITLNTPVMNRYFARTSCFSVWVRPVAEFQTDETDESQPWVRIQQVFCVTGDSPRAMYNYIRVRPRVKGRYEFRFIPRTGSDIATNSNPDAEFIQLSANAGVLGEDYSTAYGSFRLTVNGRKIFCREVLFSSELVTKPKQAIVRPPVDSTIPTAIANYNWVGDPGLLSYYKNAWLTEFLGSAFNKPVGFTGSATTVHFKPRGSGPDDDGYIKVRIQATVTTQTGLKHFQQYGTYNNWAGNGSGISFTVIQDSSTRGQWKKDDKFAIRVPISPGNPYRSQGFNSVQAEFIVTAVRTQAPDPGRDPEPSNGERFFELATQVADCSHYDEVEKSCDSGPEHELVYVNEAVSEATDEGDAGIPQYTDLAMLGLSVKSGPQITSVEQPRVWLNGGILVERLTTNGVEGVSNLFSDLLYYLMTNKSQGVGEVVPEELVDRDSFAETGKFLLQNKIHCNGVIENAQNIRSIATNQSAKNLCIFTIKNGVFGMQPALPIDSSYAISTSPITPAQIFSKGNILDGSFRLNYQNAEDLRKVGYSVRWRFTPAYELPEERTAVIYFADENKPDLIEDLDLTQFCDNEAQALMVARFTLATRRFTDHRIEFQTTPEIIGVEPGSYIRVMTEEIDFNVAYSLVVNADMTFSSARTIADGTYSAYIYRSGATDVTEQEIKIENQKLTDPTLAGAIISVFTTSESDGIYQVQELTIDESGIVSVSAVVVPTKDDLSSEIAYYTVTPGEFEVEK